MIIYIASPYSSYGDKQAAVNVQIDAFAALRDAGHQPIAPLLSHYVDQRHPASYERWMEWCKVMVSVSDMLLRVGGASDGADSEAAEARRLGKPVVYSLESIVNPSAVYEVIGDAPYANATHINQSPLAAQHRENLLEYFNISEGVLRDYEFVIDRIRALRVTPMTMHETCTGTPCVATVSVSVDALRQIRVLLGCIQRPTVSYDKDALTMAQAAVGYCGEIAAQIEALLPEDGSEQ